MCQSLVEAMGKRAQHNWNLGVGECEQFEGSGLETMVHCSLDRVMLSLPLGCTAMPE